ncbi:MAG: RHS repeat-associated core domain-containing protein, partial [Bacteroidota bacterium]
PFGLRMQDRQFEWQFDNYRFGFNGKERDKDGEWGAQTHYDYGFRIYNPSIARFLSVDPLAPDYPWYTPYQFAGNKPIAFIDLDGLEEFPAFLADEYKRDYPYFYDIITSGHFNKGILQSPKTLEVLEKYSVGMLTPEQITSDIGNGPLIIIDDQATFRGQTKYGVNETSGAGPNDITIFFGGTIRDFEQTMANPDIPKIGKQLALLNVYITFINEYTHYGDALDRYDAIMDDNGNVVNGKQDDFVEEGLYTKKVFDEGNNAVGELFGELFDPSNKTSLQQQLYDIFLNREEGLMRDPTTGQAVPQYEDHPRPQDKTIIPTLPEKQ